MASLPPANDIPVAFTASLRSWWHAGEKQSAISEERLLRRLSFYHPPSSPPPTPAGPVTATISQVSLRNPSHYLNTLAITPTEAPNNSSSPAPAILLHGYGAGLGFFFHNLPVLGSWAAKRQTPVYALDWLGMGRSARPPFTIKAKKDDIKGRVEQAESFFIDSLEEWREQMGLGRMTLIGHSLGAYFSVAYALKYPDRVHKLILLSPAGVTRGPNWTDPSREIADESTAHPGASPTFQQATKDQVKKIEQDQKNSQQVSRTRRLLIYLWERGWSPFQLLRSTLFWSPLLIGKYTSRRFPSLTPSEIRDMHEYLTNITLSKGSGEYCISHILAPWAWAHMPLVDRIAMLPREMPVTFVYGDQDWMDPVGGFESVEKLRQAGNPNGKMYIITDAGHHVYLDNHAAVNKLLLKELDR